MPGQNAMKILLRYDADWKVGFGHYSRCLALHDELTRSGWEVVHVMKHSHRYILENLEARDRQCLLLPEAMPLSEEATLLATDSQTRGFDAILFDYSTSYTRGAVDEVDRCLSELGHLCAIGLIDSVRELALVPELKAGCDVVVVPYVGYENIGIPGNVGVTLSGPRYFVFGPEYVQRSQKVRQVSKRVERVLVTFGGSDPSSVTVLAMDALSQIKDRRLDIRIVVGPGFSEPLRCRVDQFCDQTHHHARPVDAPSTLIDHMIWCDLALSSTGLTKYELALTGTPSILISINKEHDLINQHFARLMTARDQGSCTDLDAVTLAKAIVEVTEAQDERRAMSRNGMDAFDGLGTVRIVDQLLESVRKRIKTRLSDRSPEHCS